MKIALHCLSAALALLLTGLPTQSALAAFVDNGDGTVTDTVTGLIWDKCSLGQTSNTCTGVANLFTWPLALAQTTVANNANYKGHNDWRLPNVKELTSLVKRDAAVAPAIDTTAFPNTLGNRFWTSMISSSAVVPDPYAWFVGFNVGDFDVALVSSSHHVRLVRSGQASGDIDWLPTPPVDPLFRDGFE